VEEGGFCRESAEAVAPLPDPVKVSPDPGSGIVIGLDMGTGGARAVAVDSRGKVLGSASHISPPGFMDTSGVSEQVAQTWEVAAFSALGRCIDQLRKSGVDPARVEALCIDGTSGTLVLLDSDNRPLYPGIMHNDTRSFEEAEFLSQYLDDHCQEVGYRFGATFALSKLLWLKRHQPQLFEKARRVSHQADYIVGRLTGEYGISDPSNCLKMGYNLVRDEWPSEMEELGFAPLLPKVIASGFSIAPIRKEVSAEFGLRPDLLVLAGVTDSTAAFLATGASSPGEFAVSIGTTMAFKGVWKDLVRDPEGVVYCHRHPGRNWLPGGASNVGGACLKTLFPGADYQALDREAMQLFPTDSLCYPLVETGERFPFSSPIANGFFEQTEDPRENYLSLLQGVGLVEKWCFSRFARLGIDIANPVYTAGGGASSDVWCQIRAHLLQRPVARSRSTDAGFGVALLAGAQVFYGGDLEKASQAMTGVTAVFDPDPAYAEWAEAGLTRLQQGCIERGWVAGEGA
jgi:xylulokinase